LGHEKALNSVHLVGSEVLWILISVVLRMTVPDREDIEAYRHQSAEDLAAKIELINKSIRFAQCPEKDNLILSAEGKHGWS